MYINRKLAALAVALLAAVAVAAPVSAAPKTVAAETQAQMASDGKICNYVLNDDDTIASKTCAPEKASVNRWVYCNNAGTVGKLTFWDNQGYCGDSVTMNRPGAGECRYMGNWDNWAGSMVNYVNVTGYNTVLWQGPCGSSIPYLPTGYGANKPDLYADSLGNAVSNLSRSIPPGA